jgi:hypothetical protein
VAVLAGVGDFAETEALSGDGLEVGLVAAGTAITLWHFGHLTPLPAIVSGTFNATPHWQVTRNGIRRPFVFETQTTESSFCRPKRTKQWGKPSQTTIFSPEKNNLDVLARKLLPCRRNVFVCLFGVF